MISDFGKSKSKFNAIFLKKSDLPLSLALADLPRIPEVDLGPLGPRDSVGKGKLER